MPLFGCLGLSQACLSDQRPLHILLSLGIYTQNSLSLLLIYEQEGFFSLLLFLLLFCLFSLFFFSFWHFRKLFSLSKRLSSLAGIYLESWLWDPKPINALFVPSGSRPPSGRTTAIDKMGGEPRRQKKINMQDVKIFNKTSSTDIWVT